MYLPDTNIFIRAFHDIKPENLFLTEVIRKKKLNISSMVVAELLAKANAKEKEAFNILTHEFGVLNADELVARTAADYRRQMAEKSKRVILIDCFVAAHAKLHNLVLVTNDKKDFPMSDIKVSTPKEA